MGLVQLVILLVVVGVGLYYLNKVKMEQTIKTIINIVVIFVVCVFLLNLFGLLPNLNAIRVG